MSGPSKKKKEKEVIQIKADFVKAIIEEAQNLAYGRARSINVLVNLVKLHDDAPAHKREKRDKDDSQVEANQES